MDIPQFLEPMDNKHNSLNLAAKICSVFVLRHYLFLEAYSFPRASLLENYSLLGTDNGREHISGHILAPNEGYCLYIIILKMALRICTGNCY